MAASGLVTSTEPAHACAFRAYLAKVAFNGSWHLRLILRSAAFVSSSLACHPACLAGLDSELAGNRLPGGAMDRQKPVSDPKADAKHRTASESAGVVPSSSTLPHHVSSWWSRFFSAAMSKRVGERVKALSSYRKWYARHYSEMSADERVLHARILLEAAMAVRQACTACSRGVTVVLVVAIGVVISLVIVLMLLLWWSGALDVLLDVARAFLAARLLPA